MSHAHTSTPLSLTPHCVDIVSQGQWGLAGTGGERVIWRRGGGRREEGRRKVAGGGGVENEDKLHASGVLRVVSGLC